MSKKKNKIKHGETAQAAVSPAEEKKIEEKAEEAVKAEEEATEKAVGEEAAKETTSAENAEKADNTAEEKTDEPAKASEEDAKKPSDEKPKDKAPEGQKKKKDKKSSHDVEITKIQVIGVEVREEAKKASESIKKALDEALDENAEELDHPESAALQTAKKLSLRKLAMSLFGFFVLVFAVFGIIAAVSYVADYFEAKNDDSLLKQELLGTIAPLTAFDSSTFESPAVIGEDMLITAAGWDVILNPESYVQESGVYTVSQLDIDKRIASLFGSGLAYTHKTVGDEELAFIYDEETGMYTIPAYPQSPAYTPRLTGYEAVDGGYRLTVAYYHPITALINGNVSAEKIMIYTVKTSTSGYIISSLELSELITGEEL